MASTSLDHNGRCCLHAHAQSAFRRISAYIFPVVNNVPIEVTAHVQ